MKTIKEASAGSARLRLVETGREYVGLIFDSGEKVFEAHGQDPDQVWTELHRRLARSGPNWFGFDGARNRFLHWFAGGFQSPAYLRDERDYKLAAKERLEETTQVEDAATGSGHGEAVLSAYPPNQPSLSGREDALAEAPARFGRRPIHSRRRAVHAG